MKKANKEIWMQKILEDHKNQIFRICLGFSEIKEDVEDLYQEVLINAWRGIEKFEEKSSLNTWVYKITINTCLLWKRKLKSKPTILNQNLTENFTNSVEEKIIKNEKVKNLQAAINTLKKADKAIALFLLEEIPYKEIAKILGITENNVSIKVYRIKQKLKYILK